MFENMIFDMDGVLWRGMSPMPGLPKLFDTLRARNIGFVLATNNASRTIDQYVAKLAKMGVAMEPWRILTAAETTGAWLAEHYPKGTRAYVVGGEGLHVALRSRGFDVVNRQDDVINAQRAADLGDRLHPVDLVVMGLTINISYQMLALASWHVNNGARFIGANPDLSFPSEIGNLPGAGALIRVVVHATGVEPTYMGKPHPHIFNEAIQRLNGDPATTAMVGDRLETDILGAHQAGLKTVLVLSGINSREEAESAIVKPDYIFDDIVALSAVL